MTERDAAERIVRVKESLPEGADLRTERALVRLESVSIQLESLLQRAEKILAKEGKDAALQE